GLWSCIPIQANSGFSTPPAILSRAGCFSPAVPPVQVLAQGQSLEIYTVHYVIPAGASVGSFNVSIGVASAYDSDFGEIGSCGLGIDFPFAACSPATINFVAAPIGTPTNTATSTPVPLAPTATPTSQ